MNRNLIAAAVFASVLMVALGALTSLTAHFDGADADEAARLPVALAASSKQAKNCADCGVVVAVARTEKRYQIKVRMSDGSLQTVTSTTQPSWKAGDPVRLQNGKLFG